VSIPRDEPLPPIWARPEPPRRGARAQLSRRQIVDLALKIADAEGLEAVSMRRLGRDLRAGAMSLYHYFQSRDELLDLMADAVAVEMLIPGPVPADWRAALTQIAHRSRATFKAHPWMQTAVQERPRMSPNLMRHVEQTSQALAGLGEAGVDPVLLSGIALAVDDYTIGYALREIMMSEERSRGFRDAASEPYVQYLLDSGEFPMLAQFIDSGMDLVDADRFDQGLQWLLDGFAARIGR
jgi:AcrR family transcriptional regulator